jgi:transcriptional regulator GlxA family with amidase domain
VRTRSWTVALVLFDELDLLDVSGCVQALSQAGRQWNWRPFKIVPVAAKSGVVSTRSQVRLEATADFASCPDTEIVIVPGGYGALAASEDSALVAFVQERARRADLVASVGHGALVLARACLLDGLEVASTPELGTLITQLAPSTRCDASRRVVEAGKIVTAQSGTPSIELGLVLIRRLLGPKQAQAVATALGHESTERVRIDILPPR